MKSGTVSTDFHGFGGARSKIAGPGWSADAAQLAWWDGLIPQFRVRDGLVLAV